MEDLYDNYQILMDHFRLVSEWPESRVSDLISKIQLINYDINHLNVKVHDLIVSILENNIDLTEDEQQELNNAKVVNDALTAFTPCILHYLTRRPP